MNNNKASCDLLIYDLMDYIRNNLNRDDKSGINEKYNIASIGFKSEKRCYNYYIYIYLYAYINRNSFKILASIKKYKNLVDVYLYIANHLEGIKYIEIDKNGILNQDNLKDLVIYLKDNVKKIVVK